MDARTSIEDSSPLRWVAATPERGRTAAAGGWFDVAETFKKTPCIPDLKPAGRYVAKDMQEVGYIPFAMTTTLGEGWMLNGKLTAAERAEWETKRQPQPTNQTSGALSRNARRVGPAVDGVVIDPGAHEKQCYAGS